MFSIETSSLIFCKTLFVSIMRQLSFKALLFVDCMPISNCILPLGADFNKSKVSLSNKSAATSK